MPEGMLDTAMETVRNVRGKLAPLAEKKTRSEKVDSAALLKRNQAHVALRNASMKKAPKMASKGGARY